MNRANCNISMKERCLSFYSDLICIQYMDLRQRHGSGELPRCVLVIVSNEAIGLQNLVSVCGIIIDVVK